MTTRQDGGGADDLFELLYKRYPARMLRFFRRVFRVSEADAQELTQESFIRFLRTMGEYRADAEWALLETIARNTGYNHVRFFRRVFRVSEADAQELTQESFIRFLR